MNPRGEIHLQFRLISVKKQTNPDKRNTYHLWSACDVFLYTCDSFGKKQRHNNSTRHEI